ncbi:uncharacterized protein B0H18DRAFT_878513, partial [Fomitopsis serialis]|uniref:uncharacterized protein n=1 Tax=Fomitopsis serialis TaxID=139415 RepID=UPI0020089F76
VTLAALVAHASAVTSHYLDFTTSTGSYIISFSGTIVTPGLPQAGTYYLWPGLQPSDSAGVLQQVLDGRSGEWWIGSGWCCSGPALGGAGSTGSAPLSRFEFSNTVDSIATGTWRASLASGSHSATGSFALPTNPMNQAIIAIELRGMLGGIRSKTSGSCVSNCI